MRMLMDGVVAVLGVLIGLGLGYYLWGMTAADVARQLQEQRSQCEYRIAEQERRAEAAEERARQEAEARKVFEAELNRVHPLK